MQEARGRPKGQTPPAPAASAKYRTREAYLSCVEMSLNFVFKLEPIAFTVAMITTEMPAAMRPYSIAVAPDSFFRNATTLDMRHPPCGRNQYSSVTMTAA